MFQIVSNVTGNVTQKKMKQNISPKVMKSIF